MRNRMARIRVFDPACGSGNFLVIAYKQMREIEAEINRRRREPGRPTDIPLTNFRGIELRNFSAEIARLDLPPVTGGTATGGRSSRARLILHALFQAIPRRGW